MEGKNLLAASPCKNCWRLVAVREDEPATLKCRSLRATHEDGGLCS